jgi:Uma2 family endonuclease
MPMSSTPLKPWSADELPRLPPGWRYEIDAGKLVIMAPAGFRQGRLVSRIDHLLRQFVEATGAGDVTAGEVGFYLQHDPDTLRAPDVAFFGADKAAQLAAAVGFPDIPPDLAVEVHDPSERDLPRKVQQYLAAGVRSVWVVDPAAQTVTQYAPGREPVTLRSRDDTITDPCLPGFACRLRDLFGDG